MGKAKIVNFNDINKASRENILNFFEDGSPIIVEELTGVTYIGYSIPGVGYDEPNWMIKRIVETPPTTVTQYANYDKQFDKTWDNREDYFTTTPDAPVLTGRFKSGTELNLSWNKIYNAGFYLLDIALDSGFTNFYTNTTFNGITINYNDLKLSDTDGNLGITNVEFVTNIKSNTYYARVRAQNYNGTSGYSNTLTITQ